MAFPRSRMQLHSTRTNPLCMGWYSTEGKRCCSSMYQRVRRDYYKVNEQSRRESTSSSTNVVASKLD